MDQQEYLYTFVLCEVISIAFYFALSRARKDSAKSLHYIGFGLLMGFIGFFILIVASTWFDLNWLHKVLIIVGYCAFFIKSDLLESLLDKR